MLLVLALWPLFCGAPCRFQEHTLCWHWSRRTAVPVRCPYFRDWCNGLGRQRYYKPFYVSSPSIPMCCVLHLLCLSTMWSAVASLSPPLSLLCCPHPTEQGSHPPHPFFLLWVQSSGHQSQMSPRISTTKDALHRRAKKGNFSQKDWSVKHYMARPKKKKKIRRNLCVSTIFLSIYLSVVYHLSTIYQSSVFTEFRGDKAIM